MNSSTSQFKWRRVTCAGDDYAEVSLRFEKCDIGFEFVSEIDSSEMPDKRYIPSIEEAIAEAFELAGIDKRGYKVILETANDVRGEASPRGFQQCTIGAVVSYFGRDDLCPNPGLVT
jgi:hypothetical protein